MSTSHPPGPQVASGAASRAGAAGSDGEQLAGHDILCVRAPNPGPLTLTGTNTWLLGREPTWVIDPGPSVASHVERLSEAITELGGLGGVALTHDHHDHAEGVAALLQQHPAPVAGGRGEVDVLLRDGGRFGPFEALATPGHASDHFALLAGGACFTGDAVLGSGSVFISPHEGAMAGYLRALGALVLRDDFNVLCPGHGPPVWEAHERLEEYISHRLDRERSLVAALGEGRRTTAQLLDAVWSEVPAQLRPAATATLAAHLDKFEEEQRLPGGVERPSFEGIEW